MTPAATGSSISVSTFPGGSNSGTGYAIFGASGNNDDTMSQTLATQSGAFYDVSFWMKSPGGNNSHFAFNWDGGAAELDLTSPTLNFVWTLYSYSFQATSASTTISFAGRYLGEAFRLDDVSVIATEPDAPGPSVPEPSSAALVGLGLKVAAGLRRRWR